MSNPLETNYSRNQKNSYRTNLKVIIDFLLKRTTGTLCQNLQLSNKEIIANRSAFSLLEISVVILIVGILVAGITQGSKLINKSKLNAAKVLTERSPVAEIANLKIWYETSLDASFADISVKEDGTQIATWHDISAQEVARNNATQSTSANQPKFYSNIFNGGIPAVRFDGTDDYMDFDGSFLVGTNYTIFVVEQKRAVNSSDNTGFIGGTTQTTGKNLYFGYHQDSYIKLNHYGIGATTANLTSLSYSSPKTRIHSGTFSSSAGMYYWLNGSNLASNSAATTALTSYTGSAIAHVYTNSINRYYNGDLAEIIIFNRVLKTEERKLVEIYLGKKYSVEIISS